MTAIATSLVERIHSDYKERDLQRFFSIEALNNRIATCNDCEHCQYNHCQRIGCSVWRFRETLLTQLPSCPLGKHEIP